MLSSVEHRDLHSFPTRRSSDLPVHRADQDLPGLHKRIVLPARDKMRTQERTDQPSSEGQLFGLHLRLELGRPVEDRKSTRLNSSHANISYAVFCLKKTRITLCS